MRVATVVRSRSRPQCAGTERPEPKIISFETGTMVKLYLTWSTYNSDCNEPESEPAMPSKKCFDFGPYKRFYSVLMAYNILLYTIIVYCTFKRNNSIDFVPL